MSSAKGFYTAGYDLADAAHAQRAGRWRALGAATKAAHAEQLCAQAGLRPSRVVELGCGDGAVLAELARRWPGVALDGFELSPTAIAHARARTIPGTGRLEAFDGVRVDAPGDAYDLAVLTHVLEHVGDPAPLLAEAARLAPWVLVEVPLEANRSAARTAKRAQARAIGHLHAFSRASLRRLLAGADLQARAALADPLPRRHHAFWAQGLRARAAADVKWALRAALWRLAPEAARRSFTVHEAVLARRSRP